MTTVIDHWLVDSQRPARKTLRILSLHCPLWVAVSTSRYSITWAASCGHYRTPAYLENYCWTEPLGRPAAIHHCPSSFVSITVKYPVTPGLTSYTPSAMATSARRKRIVMSA